MTAAFITMPRCKCPPPAPLRPLPMGMLWPVCRCPACGGANFNIGRITAECANCDTALILSTPAQEYQNGQ